MAHLGIVIKADGTVPFDGGLKHPHRAAVLQALVDSGHAVEPAAEGALKITAGPLLNREKK